MRDGVQEIVFGQNAEAAFVDADGMPVSVTLSLDKAGDLFELNVFKADGSPLMRYPELKDFKIIKRDQNHAVVSVD